MTIRYIEDLSHCEHLLIVEGAPALVAAFVNKARNADQALSLAALLPPPAKLADIDPVMLAHFHLVFGEYEEARGIYEELNEDWPLPDQDPDSEALRGLLSSDPAITVNARQVQRNIVLHGALDATAWKRSRWGAGRDLAEVALEEISDERVHYRFTDAANRIEALQAIAAQFPALDVGAVVADFSQHKQAWFYQFANSTDVRRVEQALPEGESVAELFIDNLPEQFAYAG